MPDIGALLDQPVDAGDPGAVRGMARHAAEDRRRQQAADAGEDEGENQARLAAEAGLVGQPAGGAHGRQRHDHQQPARRPAMTEPAARQVAGRVGPDRQRHPGRRRRLRIAVVLDEVFGQEAEDRQIGRGIEAHDQREQPGPGAAQYNGQFAPRPRPGSTRPGGIRRSPGSGPEQAGKQPDQAGIDDPEAAPAGEREHQRRQQGHDRHAGRHEGAPHAHGKALVARPARPQHQRRRGDQHGNRSHAFDQPREQQQGQSIRKPAGCGAEAGRQKPHEGDPAEAPSVGIDTGNRAGRRGQAVEYGQHPAGFDQIESELPLQGGNRCRQLADLESDHDAGQHAQQDDRPACSRFGAFRRRRRHDGALSIDRGGRSGPAARGRRPIRP